MRVGGYLETKLKSESRKQKKWSLNIPLTLTHWSGGENVVRMKVRVVRKEWGLGGLRHKDDRERSERREMHECGDSKRCMR